MAGWGRGRNVGYRCSRMGAAGRAVSVGGRRGWGNPLAGLLPVAACERLVRFAARWRGAAGASEWLKYGWLPQQVQVPRVEFCREAMASDSGRWRGGVGIQFVSCGAICGGGSGARCGCGRGFGEHPRPADCERLAQRVFRPASRHAWRKAGGAPFYVMEPRKP